MSIMTIRCRLKVLNKSCILPLTLHHIIFVVIILNQELACAHSTAQHTVSYEGKNSNSITMKFLRLASSGRQKIFI